MVINTKNMAIIEPTCDPQTYPVIKDKCGNAIEKTVNAKQPERNLMIKSDHAEKLSVTPSSLSLSSDDNEEIIEEHDDGLHQRLAVLSFDQVRRLDAVMNDVISIHGRGNFPTIEVTLKDLVNVVRNKLEEDIGGNRANNNNNNNVNNIGNNGNNNNGINKVVKDIRLNGGAASYVLDTKESWQTYNDLDLIFAVELSGGRHFDRVKTAVLNSLLDLLPEGVSRKRISTCSLKEAYVSKLVKVNSDGDCWSLISLGNSRGGGYNKNVELKFVDRMRRPFEFSVDSFQIVLDSLLVFYDDCSIDDQQQQRSAEESKEQSAVESAGEEQQPQQSNTRISETFYPTVVGDSVYGDFREALYHLQKKLIATRNPEEIRGGGLLKYCNLLVRNYQPAFPENIKMLERYMCSRFFIDFPDINQQRSKLENYLLNHFIEPEEETVKYQYLLLLRNVVDESTVCLMGHERRQTLALIDEFAYNIYYYNQHRKYYQQQQQQIQHHGSHHHQQHHHHHGPHHHHHHHHQQQHHHHHGQTATYVYSNGYYYTAPAATLISPCGCNSYVLTGPPSHPTCCLMNPTTATVLPAAQPRPATTVLPPVATTAAVTTNTNPAVNVPATDDANTESSDNGLSEYSSSELSDEEISSPPSSNSGGDTTSTK